MIVKITEIVTPDRLVCAVGLLLLARWLLTTSLGRKALADSPPRPNNMPPYVSLIPLFIWFGPVPMVSMIAEKFFKARGLDLQPWQAAFLDNCIYCIGAILTGAVILVLARTYFIGRLKGFGLDPRTIVRDFGAAIVNLLAVWPLVMAVMILTIFLMTLISKHEYQMERHQELNLIVEYPQLSLRILIALVAVAVAPILEEMLFRGLIQTAIRSLLTMHVGPWMMDDGRVMGAEPQNTSHEQSLSRTESRGGTRNERRIWLAIIVSAGLFALMHANAGHWPALFVLGIGMGYAYEKSGSLFRSIFIHAMFNGATIVATLSQ